MNSTNRVIALSALMLLANDALSAEPTPAAAAPKAPAASANAMPAVAPTAPVDKGTAANSAKPTSAAATARRTGGDRLDLDTTIVTGNRELPKVLYIVPWKRSDLGDLPPQPLNSLLDEVLTPVDRDVFRREVTYYGAMAGTDGVAGSTPAKPAPGSEK